MDKLTCEYKMLVKGKVRGTMTFKGSMAGEYHWFTAKNV